MRRPLSNDELRIIDLMHRISELESAQRWIPVSERLPEDRTAALIASDKSDAVVMAMFRAGLWFGYDDNPEPWTEVTHWMPLPPPPESVRWW